MDVEAKTGRIDVSVTKDQKTTKDWLGEEIEDTIEDSLRVGRNDVATFAKTPSNRVEDPEESGEGTTHEKGACNIGTKCRCVATGFPDEDVDNIEKSNATESEVAPLVGALDEGTYKASYDHNFIDKNDEKGSRPWHASSQEEIHQKKRSSDEPINVADVEDLAVDTTNNRIASLELDVDGSPAKVGGHGKVSDGGDQSDGSGDVVEDAVLTRLGNTKTKEDKSSSSHAGADSPVPIGTTYSDCNGDALIVHDIS